MCACASKCTYISIMYMDAYACVNVVKSSHMETATSQSSSPRRLRSRPMRKHHVMQNTNIIS